MKEISLDSVATVPVLEDGQVYQVQQSTTSIETLAWAWVNATGFLCTPEQRLNCSR